MRKLISSVFMVAIAVMLASCGTSNKVLSTGDLNGEWNITAVNGKAVANTSDDARPFIGFNTSEGRMYGNSGCNRMSGMLETTAKSPVIHFNNIASTRMACPDMTLETKVLNAINVVEYYSMQSDGSLGLYDKSKNMVLKLVKK